VSTPGRRAARRIFPARTDRQRGETLVEILITIVVIGIVGSAAFYAISVGATNSKSHRDFVTADAILRNYAEAAKQAALNQCTNPTGQPLTITYPGTVPNNFMVSATGPGPGFGPPACPSSLSTVSEIDITATLPDTTTRVLKIDVRAP
jgi:prepilin-type N-terminal cleavage/methylation domain-containing protein